MKIGNDKLTHENSLLIAEKMKKCPQCKSVFDDSLNFCLMDGVVLSFYDDDIPTVVISDSKDELMNSLVKKYESKSTIYFYPNIDQFKLVNFEKRIRRELKEAVNHIKNQDVLVYLDSSFWGAGSEGAIITKDEVIISVYGNQTIQKLRNIRAVRHKGIINPSVEIAFNDLSSIKFNANSYLNAEKFASILQEYLDQST